MLFRSLYRDMASLFTDFPDWELGVITSQKTFQENIGHYAQSLKSLKAGNLDTTLYIYREDSRCPRDSVKTPRENSKHSRESFKTSRNNSKGARASFKNNKSKNSRGTY